VAETLFSYDHDALLGQPLELLVPSGLRDEHEALRRGYSDAPSARPMGSGRDLAGVRQDGAEVPIEILLSPLETPDGPAVIAGIVDISGRKRSEAALHQAIEDLSIANLGLSRANATIRHKSEEVEAFVYIVSHDLRTPLINLQGFSRELQFGCAALRRAVDAIGMPEETLRGLHTILDEDIDGTLHYIRSSATKFERLITALLELSRTGQFTLHSETLDIPAIVAATLESLGQPIGEACADIEVGALPDATGDATAVGQIFGNLIENAVKYAQPGRTPRVEIGGEVAEGMVRYWVRDNGVGIPESARARLFQVFQRFHPNMAEGEGIGLASVRRLVERHGGTVWADSAPGVGTSFHFTLPAKPQEPA
jgi:PAS domain S-box-containing protein